MSVELQHSFHESNILLCAVYIIAICYDYTIIIFIGAMEIQN